MHIDNCILYVRKTQKKYMDNVALLWKLKLHNYVNSAILKEILIKSVFP